MGRDRWLLTAAYVILVLTTAWSAWSTSEALDRIEEDVCATAEVVVANEVFTLAVFAEEGGADPETLKVALDTYIVLAEALDERCGALFLDEIPVPSMPTTTVR